MSILLPHSYSNYCYTFQNFKLTLTSRDVCGDIRNDGDRQPSLNEYVATEELHTLLNFLRVYCLRASIV